MPSDSFSRMDLSNSESETANGASESILSSSPGGASTSSRERMDSDSSDRQARFVLPGTSGSPPKILTMDEVRHAIKNVEDMSLAHEIAINPEFRLQPYDPPENSLEKKIKSILHDAFWDILREQLNSTPPCYDQAIILLGDIKENFTQIISKNNQKALDRICEVLDPQVIRQQAEQGVLDFKAYSGFIIQVMAKSCAPVRDEEVHKLNDIDDVVPLFRGILEVMDLMKLDMANCLLEAARKDVVTHSVEYEKQKFNDYLKLYTYGFPITESWIDRNLSNDERHAKAVTMTNAYLEFLNWNSENEFPELIAMDQERILTLAGRSLKLCVCASAVAIACSVPVIGQQSTNRIELSKQIDIILQNINNEKQLEDSIENICIQVKSVIAKKLNERNEQLDAESETMIKSQISQLTKKDSPVRSLMWKRLVAYVRLIRSNNSLPPVPPGYGDLADELQFIATAFKRITIYNYSVFGEQYEKILNEKCRRPTPSGNNVTEENGAGPSTSTSIKQSSNQV